MLPRPSHQRSIPGLGLLRFRGDRCAGVLKIAAGPFNGFASGKGKKRKQGKDGKRAGHLCGLSKRFPALTIRAAIGSLSGSIGLPTGINLLLTPMGQTDAMKVLFLPLCLLLSACASPAPEFFGATRTEISRDGRQYVVVQKAERVEVIRLGYAARGEHQAIRATMIDLIPEVTGCTLREATLQGDSGEMRGSLNCPA